MNKTKNKNLFHGTVEGAEFAIRCIINNLGTIRNVGRIMLTTKEERKNRPCYKSIHHRSVKARRHNQPIPIELFPPQESCDMHHINSYFTLPCLSFIHELAHTRGDLLLEGWC